MISSNKLFQSLQDTALRVAEENIYDNTEVRADHLPRHGTLYLDASSVVNMMASMDFTGWKPSSLRNFTAAMAPIDPNAPS